MIQDIENLDSQFSPILAPPSRQTDASCYLHVKRGKSRIATCQVAWTDEVSIFVDNRIGKSTTDVEDRGNRHSVLEVKRTPKNKSVRSIPR